MAIQVDSQHSHGFLKNIICSPHFNCLTTSREGMFSAKTNNITHHNSTFFIAWFHKFMKYYDSWDCNFFLSANKILCCTLKIHIRELVTITINGNKVLLIENDANDVQYTRVPSIYYTKGDILNIDILKSLDVTLSITDIKGDILFSHTDDGHIQFILNMNYFSRYIHISATINSMYRATQDTLRFDLIPIEDAPKNYLLLNIGGANLTPYPKKEKEFYYKYIYKYDQTLSLSCESSTIHPYKLTYNGSLIDVIKGDNKITSNVVLTHDSKVDVIFQLEDDNGQFIEKLHIEFIYVSQRGELLITGLPLHKTRVQLKTYTQYMYTENENLTLTCSGSDWYSNNCSSINWQFEEEIVSDTRTAVHTNDTCLVTNTFRLTKEYNGKSLRCFNINEIYRIYTSIYLFMEVLNEKNIINQQGDSRTTKTEAGQSQQKIIIIGASIVVIIIVAVAIFLISVAFRNKDGPNQDEQQLIYNDDNE